MSAAETYCRCTVAFVEGDRVVGSVMIEVVAARLADPEFVGAIALDQLRRRGPSGARAVLLRGQLSDAQCCVALAPSAKEIA